MRANLWFVMALAIFGAACVSVVGPLKRPSRKVLGKLPPAAQAMLESAKAQRAKFRADPKTDLIVVQAYEAGHTPGVIVKETPTNVELRVDTGKKVKLFLTSYRRVEWDIRPAKGTEIVAVSANGYEPPAVKGVPAERVHIACDSKCDAKTVAYYQSQPQIDKVLNAARSFAGLQESQVISVANAKGIIKVTRVGTLNNLSYRLVELPGAPCPKGGVRILKGVDRNGNNDLDLIELDSLEYECETKIGAPKFCGVALQTSADGSRRSSVGIPYTFDEFARPIAPLPFADAKVGSVEEVACNPTFDVAVFTDRHSHLSRWRNGEKVEVLDEEEISWPSGTTFVPARQEFAVSGRSTIIYVGKTGGVRTEESDSFEASSMAYSPFYKSIFGLNNAELLELDVKTMKTKRKVSVENIVGNKGTSKHLFQVKTHDRFVYLIKQVARPVLGQESVEMIVTVFDPVSGQVVQTWP